jgi:phage shock protein PspC (stress-responsive transcriptional regulator)
MGKRALHSFKTLPWHVRLLWVVAAFVGLNVTVRLIA